VIDVSFIIKVEIEAIVVQKVENRKKTLQDEYFLPHSNTIARMYARKYTDDSGGLRKKFNICVFMFQHRASCIYT
jgi:hypothetical protein